MSMNILLWNGRTLLMNTTRELPEIQLQRLCTNGYTWRFRMHEHAWARSVMRICAMYNVFFHNRHSTSNTFLPNSATTLHARGAWAHNLFSHLPFRMDNFVCRNGFSFRYSIDWCVHCVIGLHFHGLLVF